MTLDRAVLRPGWPLAVYFTGYPLLWATGIANFAGPLFAVPMLAWLARRDRVHAPRGSGLYLLFLGWVLVSAAGLADRGSPFPFVGFLYRAAQYGSSGIFLVYTYNVAGRYVSADRLAAWLARLWIATVVLGLAALVLPAQGFRSPVEHFVPTGMPGADFIHELVHPKLAQVQDFLGYPVPRPAAPYVYANDWGASLVLLTPMFVATWVLGARPVGRLAGSVLMAVALVPLVVSLNRGAWLVSAVGIAYGAWTARRRLGDQIPVGPIITGAAVVGVLVASPLGGLIGERLATPHSNESRLTLYAEAVEQVKDSPLYGYGAPRATVQVGRSIPPVGTQGMFWMVLFSHGVVGAALFVAWFFQTALRTHRCGDRTATCAHITVVLALVSLPFYGMLPTQLHIVAVAAAIATQPSTAQPTPPAPPRGQLRRGP